MPVTCTHCGKELPRDDARFCSNCGTRVAPSSLNAGSQLMKDKASPDAQKPASLSPSLPPTSPIPPISPVPSVPEQRRKPVLREQIAHQPRPARLTRHFEGENAGPDLIAQPLEDERRELRVRVWDQPDIPTQTEVAIDDLPTQETPANSPTSLPMSPKASPAWSLPVAPPPSDLTMHPMMDASIQEQERRREQMEQQSTAAMPQMANIPAVPSEPRPTPFFGIQGVQNSAPVVPPTPVIHTTTSPHSEDRSISGRPITLGPSSESVSPQFLRQRARRGPTPLVLLAALVFAVIIAAIAWIRIAQPFNVPSVTQPLQSYRDTHLGFALSYPSDWRITHQSSSDLFSDSSQTAQVMVTQLPASNAPGGSTAAYLQKQAAKVGMSGAKTLATISFAGTTWQQVQGNVQINGVNDTETLFATLHHNQLLVLTQIAPQSVYADEESVIFSKMRASLQLL